MTSRVTTGRARWAMTGHALAVACMTLLGPACDKMPLTAPSSSTITLSAAKLTVGLNGTVQITATVIESAGTAVQNGTVVTFSTTLGTVTPVEAQTSGGRAVAQFVSGAQSGTAEINAFSGGSSAKDTVKISVGAAAAGKVELLANPTALPSTGGKVQLTAVVSDASGNRLGGVPVSFTTDTGFLSEQSVLSDGNGESRTQLTTTAKAIVSASVVGGTNGTVKSESLTIPVRVGPSVTIGTIVAGVPGAASTIPVTVTPGGAAVTGASISFGDGSSLPLSISPSATTTTSVSHVYTRSSTFVVTATATDAAGESASATSSVSIQDVVVSISTFSVTPASPTKGVSADFSVTATSSNSSGAPIERYEWKFGDGATVTTYGSSTTSHIYAAAIPRCVISVRVVTTSGASATATKEIVVQ